MTQSLLSLAELYITKRHEVSHCLIDMGLELDREGLIFTFKVDSYEKSGCVCF